MKDKTFAKIVVIVSIIICLPLLLIAGRILSTDSDTHRTYDGTFQILRYNYNQRYNDVSITLKDEDTKKVITAQVRRDCSNQPINKIIKATIRETTKDFLLFERSSYEVIDGKVCM